MLHRSFAASLLERPALAGTVPRNQLLNSASSADKPARLQPIMPFAEPIPQQTRLLRASEAAIAAAAACLRDGGLVAFPTETVYGLGADATNATAIAQLYAAKGRPAFNPLIAHVAGLAEARLIGRFDATAERLANAFWPGPLTLVLPKTAACRVADLATAGLDTVAIRVPAHPTAQALLRAVGGPVVAPSANISGHVSPTTAAHVHADLEGRIDLIVDGGAVEVGVESTIVGCFEVPTLLRPGGVPSDAIEAVLGAPLARPMAEHAVDTQPAAGAGHAGLALCATRIRAARRERRYPRERRCSASARTPCPAPSMRLR